MESSDSEILQTVTEDYISRLLSWNWTIRGLVLCIEYHQKCPSTIKVDSVHSLPIYFDHDWIVGFGKHALKFLKTTDGTIL